MRGWKQGDGFWQGKKAENVLISFLTSGFAVFICLWLLVLPISSNLINHVLSKILSMPWKTFFISHFSVFVTPSLRTGSTEIYIKKGERFFSPLKRLGGGQSLGNMSSINSIFFLLTPYLNSLQNYLDPLVKRDGPTPTYSLLNKVLKNSSWLIQLSSNLFECLYSFSFIPKNWTENWD